MADTAVERVNVQDEAQLWRVVEDVHLSKQPRLVRHDGVDLAIVMPVETTEPQRRTRRAPAGRPLTEADPLTALIGSVRSDGPGDVSENKRKYLAQAYAPNGE